MTVRVVRGPVYLYKCDTCGAEHHACTLPKEWRSGQMFGDYRNHLQMCGDCLGKLIALFPLIKPFIEEDER